MNRTSEISYKDLGVPYGGHGSPYVHCPMPLMVLPPGQTAALESAFCRSGFGPLEHCRSSSHTAAWPTSGTPLYGTFPQLKGSPQIANTSPRQSGFSDHIDPTKSRIAVVPDRVIDRLLKQEHIIPRAIPAVFTPLDQMKSLEQSLENRIAGNRNVYIRGLHPTTDDTLLHNFVSRFGTVETSKAIIDSKTDSCKGFGFAKFFNVLDSERCIRGLYQLGYEVGFAREPFKSRLKAEGDKRSTNLYISNLPKRLTEVELGTIFKGYLILSSKILRDKQGYSCGVGFVRFESREICDEVIREFNEFRLGEEGLSVTIRYADTPAQRELKRVTAQRRQFRMNEYSLGAYGIPFIRTRPTPMPFK